MPTQTVDSTRTHDEIERRTALQFICLHEQAVDNSDTVGRILCSVSLPTSANIGCTLLSCKQQKGNTTHKTSHCNASCDTPTVRTQAAVENTGRKRRPEEAYVESHAVSSAYLPTGKFNQGCVSQHQPGASSPAPWTQRPLTCGTSQQGGMCAH
jgi:hypothetical protein